MWKENKVNGHSRYSLYGAIYHGDFKNAKMEGKNVHSILNEFKKYEDDFVDSMKH